MPAGRYRIQAAVRQANTQDMDLRGGGGYPIAAGAGVMMLHDGGASRSPTSCGKDATARRSTSCSLWVLPPFLVVLAASVWATGVHAADPEEEALAGLECSDDIPGAECPDLQKAVRNGGTVILKRGVYHQCAVISEPTVIEGNGARIEGRVCQGKAAFVTNADTELRNLTCSNHRVRDGNGACVRQQRGDLTLRNVTIRGSQNGVLAGGRAGDLEVIDSELSELGGDCSVKCGRAHGIYYSGTGRLNIRGSRLRRPRDQGHLVKTGARRTEIENSVLDETGGGGSRIIDAFNGGVVTIRNSHLVAARNDGNSTVIGFDYEGRTSYTENEVSISNGRIECAGGQLLAGSNSLESADVRIRTDRVDCR